MSTHPEFHSLQSRLCAAILAAAALASSCDDGSKASPPGATAAPAAAGSPNASGSGGNNSTSADKGAQPARPSSSGLIEGERGGSSIMPRGNASREATLLLLPGRQAHYTFRAGGSSAVVEVHYSDDGGASSLKVLVDGKNVGTLGTRSTGGGGAGWNRFASTRTTSFKLSGKGSYDLVLRAGGDSFGVEIDFIRIISE